jgi:predicted secreted hydrolase
VNGNAPSCPCASTGSARPAPTGRALLRPPLVSGAARAPTWLHLAATLLLTLLPNPAPAQGLYGMAAEAPGFALPDPDHRFDFPADHGPHPDFRIEWWYVTANLDAPDGTPFGIQWTLFRTALAPGEAPGWSSPQIWFGHAGLTTPDRHFVAERFARGGIGQAGVTAEPFDAFIDEWHMRGPTISDVTLHAQGTDFAYTLDLTTDAPFVPQGADGYSVKSEAGQASHYYSQPFYEVTGTLTLPEGDIPVTGIAWLDREWSSQPLTESQTGWDWFSLTFDTGEKFMGYRLRDRDAAPYAIATWIAPDGTPTPYPPGAFAAEPLTITQVDGRAVPTSWRVTLPDRGLDVTVAALNPQSWMDTAFPYWEGPVIVTGSHPGRGYLEMTGYE